MEYIELRIQGVPEEQQDILIFHLGEAGFESFAGEGEDVLAYIQENMYNPDVVTELFQRFPYLYKSAVIPEQNWNREWEKNFPPVEIAGRCFVRAPFHPAGKGFEYEIIVEPKMSFGTAHHETTSQMIEMMLEMDFKGKKVLDMGCGTGILAIMAEKLGALLIHAVDNDQWAYNNSVENITRNSMTKIIVTQGGIEDVSGSFDVILANINRNVLLDHLPRYAKLISPDGVLLMSGFYQEDVPLILDAAMNEGFITGPSISKNRWVALKLFR